jgi:hypothetical protein
MPVYPGAATTSPSSTATRSPPPEEPETTPPVVTPPNRPGPSPTPHPAPRPNTNDRRLCATASADLGARRGFMTSTTSGATAKTPFPREAGNRRVCPALGSCGSLGLSDCGLQPVPWFHENALLLVDGRGVAYAEDGAGCAAGEQEGGTAGLVPALLRSHDGHPPGSGRSQGGTRGRYRRGPAVVRPRAWRAWSGRHRRRRLGTQSCGSDSTCRSRPHAHTRRVRP